MMTGLKLVSKTLRGLLFQRSELRLTLGDLFFLLRPGSNRMVLAVMVNNMSPTIPTILPNLSKLL